MSSLGSWSLTAALLVGVNYPGSQENLASNWEPGGSLVKGAISGTRIGPHLPALAASLPPAGVEAGPQVALLWYLLSPLFSEQAWQCLRLELFTGKLSLSLFFPLSGYSREFGLLSHISSLSVSSGHSGPVLTLSMLPVTPCSVPARCWPTGASGPLLCWEFWLGNTFCGVFWFFLSSLLHCPLRFQNYPQTHQWEGFLVFGNFFSFTTPSLGWVSVPNSFVSVFIFIFCPTSFWRKWAAFLGAWCPPPTFRSCFVEFAQRSIDLLMNLLGRKWSPCPIPLSS